MAGLLHDLGHACFSHIGESIKIYPDLSDPLSGQPASGHEAYTRCIIKERIAPVIEKYWKNEEYYMVPHILMILNQSSDDAEYRFFDDIISGQLDCDKMDYLLRDSYYCGVEYGMYDLDKLIDSLRVAKINGTHVLAISQNGIQAVEAFVLARYWMFIQVYFHKYRRLFDYYLSSFTKELLTIDYEETGQYPQDLNEYLKFDDICLYERIKEYASITKPQKELRRICYYAKRLYTRKHHKAVFDPPYVHYNNRDESGTDDYKRLSYVKKQLQAYLDGLSVEKRCKVYIDLATGSSTKQYFDIKMYNEEQDPDYVQISKDQEMIAIPVIPKHDGTIHPIQHYSFTLRSISDRKISILRIYAEEEMLDDVRQRCIAWFRQGYDMVVQERFKLKRDIDARQKELEELKKRESILNQALEP